MENRKNILPFSIKNRKNRKTQILPKNMYNTTEKSAKLIEFEWIGDNTCPKSFNLTVKLYSIEAVSLFLIFQQKNFVKLMQILRETAKNLTSYYLRFLRFLRFFKKFVNRKNLKNRKNRKMFYDWTP